MPNQIQIFQFESQSIPTVIENGEAYFAVNELAQVLGFSNPRQAITSHVDKDDVQKLDTTTEYGNRRKNFVNESGMYSLVFGSSKPEAKRFKKWVTSEVLPSIRKNGNYQLKPVTPEIPQTLPEALPNKSAITVDKFSFIRFNLSQGLKNLSKNGNSPRQRVFFMPKFYNLANSINFMSDGARNTTPARGITPPDFCQVLSRWTPFAFCKKANYF